MSKRPFRFAVTALAGNRNATRWREKVRRVEDLGYSSIFTMDHVNGTPFGPIAAMCFAAEASRALHIGSMIFANDFRHPVLLAKEMATVDLLSDGRLELGLGAGWWPDDYQALGITFERGGLRLDRLEESIRIMKSFFVGDKVSYHGAHYSVTGVESRPSVSRRPGPPLILGGSRRRMLTLAAREADIVSVNCTMGIDPVTPVAGRSSTAAATREKVEWIREAAGDRYDSIELECPVHVVNIGPSASAGLDAFAVRYGVDRDDARSSLIALFGSVDEVVERLEERRAEFDFSYIAVGDQYIDEFAPVVARLTGT